MAPPPLLVAVAVLVLAGRLALVVVMRVRGAPGPEEEALVPTAVVAWESVEVAVWSGPSRPPPWDSRRRLEEMVTE